MPTQSIPCFLPFQQWEKAKTVPLSKELSTPSIPSVPTALLLYVSPNGAARGFVPLHATSQLATWKHTVSPLPSTQHRSWGELWVLVRFAEISGLLEPEVLIWVQLGLHSAFPILLHLKPLRMWEWEVPTNIVTGKRKSQQLRAAPPLPVGNYG